MSKSLINNNQSISEDLVIKVKKQETEYYQKYPDSLIPKYAKELHELGFVFEISSQAYNFMPKHWKSILPVAINYYQMAMGCRIYKGVEMHLIIKNFGGHFVCKSNFNISKITVSEFTDTFFNGVTVLQGEIDSVGWVLCYALAFCGKDRRIIIDTNSKIDFNGENYQLDKFSQKVGYIDPVIYSSFIKRRVTVRQYIYHILSKSKSIISIEEVKNAFNLSGNRFNRPLCENGNETLRAIAAIEYAKDKEVFCFPWFSTKMLSYYWGHVEAICDFLNQKKKIVLLPTSSSYKIDSWNIKKV